MLYRQYAPSNTSLSDDGDDDETTQSNFFTGDQPLFIDTAIQPHWSSQSNSHKQAALKSPIATVPPEILMYILKHLHHPRDLLSALRVSRTWCECAVELLWHKPAFSRYGTLEKMARLLRRPKQIFSYAKFIRRLNFLSLGSDLRDDVFTIFSHCNRVERLTLNGCKFLTAPTLEATLTCFSSLVALDLTNVKATTSEVVIAFSSVAKRLQGINLQSCKQVTDSAIIALAENCPLLRRVKLSGLEFITDQGVSAIVKGCPLLLEIDLHQCALITDLSIRDIWTHSFCMREMRLSMCKNLTDQAFPALPSANPFPHNANDELPPLIVDRTLEQLRMLDLTACANITDDAIEGIISHAPKMRNFVLSKCTLLTDRSVEAICHLGRNLHYLHLGHASKITDRSVKTLARACNRIRYVDFANCTNLTDMSVFELSALPKLRRIGLVRVNNLTDEAIYALAERHATLERIHLSYCDQISVMAVHFLLLKLHKLTHLSLTGVPAFRQTELQSFCRDAPPDFNSAQRQSFCVFSGRGISQLRTYLTELFDQITEQNGTDDTEYEDEDDDTVAFQENDTPEPEIADLEDDMPLDLVHAPPPDHVTIAGRSRNAQSRFEAFQNTRAQALVVQRERAIRLITAPMPNLPTTALATGSPAANRMQAESAVQGATSVLNHQLQQANTARRERGAGSVPRNVSDILPIVESPTSAPSPEEDRADHFSPGDMPLYYPERGFDGPGARPPNFPDIGHGWRNDNAGSSNATNGERTFRQPYAEVDRSHPLNGSPTNPRTMSDPGTMAGLVFSRNPHPEGSSRQAGRRDAMDVDETTEPRAHRLRDSILPYGDGIHRSSRMQIRTRIRNSLNTAENYASTFFGRLPIPPPQDPRHGDNNTGNTMFPGPRQPAPNR